MEFDQVKEMLEENGVTLIQEDGAYHIASMNNNEVRPASYKTLDEVLAYIDGWEFHRLNFVVGPNVLDL